MNDDQDSLLNQWLAQQMSQRPGGIPSAGPSPAPAVGGPSSSPAPDIKSVPRETASSDPMDKIADSHPGLQPDELTPYLKGQESQVDQFGPEKQAALMQHLQQGYKSPGNILAKGGATFADALMQGVARAGNPGNLQAINENENRSMDRAADMGKNLNAQKLQAIKEKMGLESQSAKTPLGGSHAAAAQFLAKQVFPNIKPAQLQAIGQNPQALSAILGPGVDLQKALAEVESSKQFRMAQLDLQSAGLEQTGQHQKAEENIAQQGKDLEKEKEEEQALKETAEHPILHPINAMRASSRLGEKALGAPSFQKTATNKKTGEKMGFDGSKWVPIQ